MGKLDLDELDYSYWWTPTETDAICNEYSITESQLRTNISIVAVPSPGSPRFFPWTNERYPDLPRSCNQCGEKYHVANREAYLEQRWHCNACGYWLWDISKPCLGKKSVFDSGSELRAFQTIKGVIPNGFLIIPNAALLSFIDLKAVDEQLDKSLREYIFKGRVDLLIVEPRNYTALLAVELDSAYHDNELAQARDEKKNMILQIAGVPLKRYRIHDARSYAEIEFDLKEFLYGKTTG